MITYNAVISSCNMITYNAMIRSCEKAEAARACNDEVSSRPGQSRYARLEDPLVLICFKSISTHVY